MKARPTRFHVAFGCLIYGVALVATFPVPWVSHVIERASTQMLVLRDPIGTAWAGSGRLYARQRSGDLLDLGTLRWSTAPSGILGGKVAADFGLGDTTKTMRLEWSPASMVVRGLSLELPGKVFAGIVPGLEALGPEGKVRIRSDDLRIDANSILGLADVEWRQVRLAHARGIELGSHIARLRGGGSKVDIELGTIDGPVRLSGGGSWTRKGGLVISGTLEHGANSAATLVPFLRGICSEYQDARCQFRFAQ